MAWRRRRRGAGAAARWIAAARRLERALERGARGEPEALARLETMLSAAALSARRLSRDAAARRMGAETETVTEARSDEDWRAVATAGAAPVDAAAEPPVWSEY